jgi:hypothetical protein
MKDKDDPDYDDLMHKTSKGGMNADMVKEVEEALIEVCLCIYVICIYVWSRRSESLL